MEDDRLPHERWPWRWAIPRATTFATVRPALFGSLATETRTSECGGSRLAGHRAALSVQHGAKVNEGAVPGAAPYRIAGIPPSGSATRYGISPATPPTRASSCGPLAGRLFELKIARETLAVWDRHLAQEGIRAGVT